MKGIDIFDPAMKLLGRALDFRALRHNVISSNIANIDTPRYRGFDVVLKGELSGDGAEDRLVRTHQDHLGGGGMDGIRPQVVQSTSSRHRMDGNSVDVDMEMTKLAENAIQYEALAQSLAQKLSMLKYAIDEGGNR